MDFKVCEVSQGMGCGVQYLAECFKMFENLRQSFLANDKVMRRAKREVVYNSHHAEAIRDHYGIEPEELFEKIFFGWKSRLDETTDHLLIREVGLLQFLNPREFERIDEHNDRVRHAGFNGGVSDFQICVFMSGTYAKPEQKDPVDDVIAKIEKIRESLLKMQETAKAMRENLKPANNFGFRTGNLLDVETLAREIAIATAKAALLRESGDE